MTTEAGTGHYADYSRDELIEMLDYARGVIDEATEPDAGESYMSHWQGSCPECWFVSELEANPYKANYDDRSGRMCSRHEDGDTSD